MGKKILLYSHYFYPSLGGLENASRILANGLLKQGHEVSVLTYSPEEGKKLPDDLRGVRIVRTPSLICLLASFFLSDLVIVNGGSSLRAELCAWVTQKPLVIIHQMAVPLERREGKFAHLTNSIRKRLSLRASHICVSVSVRNIVGIPASVIAYNPVDPVYYRSKLVSHENFLSSKQYDFAYIGRLYRWKGVYEFLSAMEKLAQKGTRFHAVICGAGDEEGNIQRIIQEGPLKEHVVLIPGLEKEKLAELFNKIKFLVLVPYGHREGCPLVIGEAFSQGIPVVGSSQDALRETIGQAGWIVPEGDIDSLFSCLEELLQMKYENYEIYHKEALKRSMLFTPSAFVEAVLSSLGLDFQPKGQSDDSR